MESHSSHVGTVVKRARGPISIRELGRRSGVSPGQISRIESGETDKPSTETLTALASALGGNPAPLLKAAGYTGTAIDSEIKAIRESFNEDAENTDAISESLNEIEVESIAGEDAELLFYVSRRIHSRDFGDASGAISEIARAWPAITSERRKLIRAFVADQEVLSSLDRLPSVRGRYAVSIDLEDLSEEVADD